ncbi:MAG TPA: hypothetical protein VN253_17865 [Kofleriaceae bacterium]|nr:hypothetical protein [Kofleriaceae bacterium]
MSEPNVLVSFRLDRDRPTRIRWLATDGVPGDGYKAQITAILLADGTRLQMHGSSILEQTSPDPAGGIGGYLLTFNGMVGYAADHGDRPRIERLLDEEVAYELEFVHEDGRVAVADRDYKLVEQPRAMAHKLSHRHA